MCAYPFQVLAAWRCNRCVRDDAGAALQRNCPEKMSIGSERCACAQLRRSVCCG
ncbi:putative membrane protein [Xanthomonas citri pv. punicae str. LMG 859]|nr:putative membrane protein [Xanthomonas citri pv. punicae str. LMG 859]